MSLRKLTSPTRLSGIVAIVAIAVVVMMALGLSLAGQRAFHGSDILESFAPWRSVPPDAVQPTNPLVGDTVDSILPARAVFRGGLYDGRVALWSSNVLGGRPLASVPNTGTFSPLNVSYWVLPLWYAPGFAKLLELLVAIGFTALFLRNLGLGRASALLGGLIFAFTGFQVAWNNWPQTHVGALIAALFWATDLAIRRGRLLTVVPLALVVATMWFEGFPSVTGYALLFVGAYALVRMWSLQGISKKAVAIGSALGGVVVGTSLAAVQLVPFYYSLQSLDLSTRAQSSNIHLPLRAIATFVVPNAFGSPVDRNYFGPINYIEIQAFIGVVAVILIVSAAAYGRKVIDRSVFWYFVSAVVFALVLLFIGGPLLGLLQKSVLFGANFIGRLRSVLGFLLAVIAAIGFEALVRGLPSRSKIGDRIVFVVISSVALVVVGGALYRSWQMALAYEQTDYLVGHLVAAGGVFVIGATVVGLAHGRSETLMRLPLIVLPLLISFEIVRFVTPFWPQIPVEQFYPSTASHEFLTDNVGDDRIAVAGLAMYPSTTALYGLRSVTGHAFHEPEWQDLLEAVDPEVMHASPTFSIFASNTDIARSPVLDRLSARYFVADPRLRVAGRRQEVARIGDVALNDGFEVVVPLEGVPRGVSLELSEGFDPGPIPDRIIVETLDADGRVSEQGIRRFDAWLPQGFVDLAVPESAGRIPAMLRIRYEGDTPMMVRGDIEGEPSIGLILAEEDGLRVVFAAGTVIYERLSSLPRIRWAGRAIVMPSPQDRISTLAAGVASDTVVLSTPGFLGAGAGAEITAVRDKGDVITIDVTASGDGYLVVADSMQKDWEASVDGERTAIVPADHALAAIEIGTGTHSVILTYRPAGWRSGGFVTIASIIALLAIATIAAAQMTLQRRSDDDCDGQTDEQ